MNQILAIFFKFMRDSNVMMFGLSGTVAREIVESHGGKILVESEIGKGSKFSVILYQQ